MYQSHQPKRRKKRPIHGLKTVDVTRGKAGYGFTITGQHPCVLNCVLSNSPAERVGLHPGDYLLGVNGIDVSKLCHDDVVRMVGLSTGTLTIQVGENYNSSDSSDDDFYPRAKAKYSHKSRYTPKGYGKIDKPLANINMHNRHCLEEFNSGSASQPLPNVDINKYDLPKSRSRLLCPRLNMPVETENCEIMAEGTRHTETRATDVFKVPFQKSMSSNISTASNIPMHKKTEPKQAFLKSTSSNHVRAQSGIIQPPTKASQLNQISHMYDNFSPNSIQRIINQSLTSYSVGNEAFMVNKDDVNNETAYGLWQPNGTYIRTVVGYIGSLEMPADASFPNVRIQSIRNAVRRLRVEQKIHTLVLMIIIPNLGVKLIDLHAKELAYYPVDKLAFSGVCPDDHRFFAVVTLHSVSDSGGASCREKYVGNSCHVFMVDQELTAHNIHAHKAKTFGIECTVDPLTQCCMEFPCSTTPIILSISSLYKDRPGSLVENDVARSQVFANPNQPVEQMRPSSSSSSSSSTSSNGDSGLGLCREDNYSDRVPPPVVNVTPPPPLPALAPQLPQIKWSGNTLYLTDGPVKHVKNVHENCQEKATAESVQNISSEECIRATDRLNIRVMTNTPSPKKNLTPFDGMDQQNAASNLRLEAQKLRQAWQRGTGCDPTSSDTESHSSHSDIHFTPEVMDRPVSAPFKHLAGESPFDLKGPVSDLSQLKLDSDSSLVDKLSPRAFLSSAFTPIGSAASAFKKIRSRSRLREKRSPSAPPAPNYHGDDEDSENDARPKVTKRFQKDKPRGRSSVGSIKPWKLVGTNTGLTNRKHQDHAETSLGTPDSAVVKATSFSTSLDKWTRKGSQSSLRKQKPLRQNPLSLSHESLVTLEQDTLQQKLASASSVNNIANHVANSTEQDNVGRVSGWAVSFDKLLKDALGNTIFTDFLKKEFSEENVEFWKACEDFKTILDSNNRKSRAKEIYDKHVSARASEGVNIDSVARRDVEKQLDNPTPQTFHVAQQQIFQLMKQDSYARFLKSECYKSVLMREMEGKPLQHVNESTDDKVKSLDKGNDKDGKKKGKENEEKPEKRRSLLPWRQKSKKKSKSDSEDKNSKSDKDNNREIVTTTTTSAVTTATMGAVAMANMGASATIDPITRKEIVQVVLPKTIEEESETPKFCRVIMPDGSTTVVGTRQGQTIHYILGKLCEKRGLTIANVEVHLLGSDQPLNLNEDISTLGSKEITVERRVLFRMDFPNKKSIGVKAKPNRLIRDVLQPILTKYGYRIEYTDVCLYGQSNSLCMDNYASTLDGLRVVVMKPCYNVPANGIGVFGHNIASTRPPIPNQFNNHGNNTNNYFINTNNSRSLEDFTNEIFGSVMLDKSDHLLANNFDELTTLDLKKRRQGEIAEVQLSMDSCIPQNGDLVNKWEVLTKDYGKLGKGKQKVTFALQKNTVRSRPNEIDDEKDPKCANDLNLDKLGLAPSDVELIDILPGSLNNLVITGRHESAPAAIGRDVTDDGSIQNRDFLSEIDDYIEDINDNIALYTRGSNSNRHGFAMDGNNVDLIKQSLPSGSNTLPTIYGRDELLPSNYEAEKLLGVSYSKYIDINDPHLATESSVADRGLNYCHDNKLLANSRNFVKQRQKQITNLFSVDKADVPLASSEMLSPSKAFRNDPLDKTYFTEATLANSSNSNLYSSNSSPYSSNSSSFSSNSSLDHENATSVLPKSKFRNVQQRSRHTLFHSPNTRNDDDNCLSTVDTDGRLARHSAPKNLGSRQTEGVKMKLLNSSTADEVTFV